MPLRRNRRSARRPARKNRRRAQPRRRSTRRSMNPMKMGCKIVEVEEFSAVGANSGSIIFLNYQISQERQKSPRTISFTDAKKLR